MTTTTILVSATDTVLADINALLPQLRSDPEQQSGSLDDLRDIVENNWTRMVVARDGERIVGMATLHVVNNVGKRVGHVDDVVVDAAHRRRGMAEAIMRHLIAVARDMQVSQLRLTSRPARADANRLYPRLGFTIGETNLYVLKLGNSELLDLPK
ncbi:hypothetical protein BH10PSE9_BH10PSE9_24240 [soil metagenome]